MGAGECLGRRDLRAQDPRYRITDVAEAIGPDCERPIVGIRPGEKLHEEMITASDSFNTVDLGDYYAILPSAGKHTVESYSQAHGGQPVTAGFAYNSGTNDEFLDRGRDPRTDPATCRSRVHVFKRL